MHVWLRGTFFVYGFVYAYISATYMIMLGNVVCNVSSPYIHASCSNWRI